MKPLVSLIILNWNGKKNLEVCLNSLKKVSYKPLETIVVDNNSNDGSVQSVKENYPWVILVANKTNRGYCGGNNDGIKKSRGKYIFILNNDTAVTQGFLEPLVERLEDDQKIACIQPKLVYATDKNLLNAVGSYLTDSGFLYHYGYRKNASLAQYNRPLDIYCAKGAAMLLRRSALDKVGTFDEDFFIYFEETDLCHRFWLAGYRVVYEPKSLIHHAEAVDTHKQLTDYFINYLSFRNRICSYLKNLETINLISILGQLELIYLFLSLFYLITLRPAMFWAILNSQIWNLVNLPRTLKKRRDIQTKLRKASDQQIFISIKRNPPIIYYYYLFTTLKNFKNEKTII